jgi:AraC-like DNA-binding protein
MEELYDAHGQMIISLDTSVVNKNHMYAPHTHANLEVSFVKGGTGIYRIEDRTYNMTKNDIFIISNTELHNIVVQNNDVLTNMVIHFQAEFLWDFLGQTPDYRFLNVFFSRGQNFQHRLDRNNPATPKAAKLLLEIEQEMKTRRLFYDLQVKILLKSLLLLILREYDCFEPDADFQAITPNDAHKTKDILRFINLNLAEHLTLNSLASQACLSPTYFSVLFKRYNGINLSEYITKKRVELAIGSIRTTNYTLTEIAQRCGFNNSTSFNKAFRRITGEAPSYYRKN